MPLLSAQETSYGRRAFWVSAWNTKSHYWRFWLLSLVAATLATLAGPSSTIAMIPSLNWFTLDQPFNNEVLPLYVFNASTVLWPDTVTGKSVNGLDSGNNCIPAAGSGSIQDECPAGGFRDTYAWAGNLMYVNTSAGTNISFLDIRGSSRRVLFYRSCASRFDGRASGISLNTFVTGEVTAFEAFAQNSFDGLALTASQPRLSLETPSYAPQVEVMCNGFDYYSISEVENRGIITFPSFDSNHTFLREDYILLYTGPFNATESQWVVVMPVRNNNPAISAAVRVPWIY